MVMKRDKCTAAELSYGHEAGQSYMPALEFSYGREAGRTYMAALEDGVSRGTTTHGNFGVQLWS